MQFFVFILFTTFLGSLGFAQEINQTRINQLSFENVTFEIPKDIDVSKCPPDQAFESEMTDENHKVLRGPDGKTFPMKLYTFYVYLVNGKLECKKPTFEKYCAIKVGNLETPHRDESKLKEWVRIKNRPANKIYKGNCGGIHKELGSEETSVTINLNQKYGSCDSIRAITCYENSLLSPFSDNSITFESMKYQLGSYFNISGTPTPVLTLSEEARVFLDQAPKVLEEMEKRDAESESKQAKSKAKEQ